MITLYGFGPSFGVADASSFVLKVDAYMCVAGIPFEVNTDFDAFKNAPKGKLPYIKDDNKVIADSTFILQHLQQKYDVQLDAHLSDEQKALSQLISRSLDEDFYWTVVYSRWVRDAGWDQVKAAFFGAMPFPLKYIVPIIARRGMVAACNKQGISRHSDAEITAIADNTLNSLSVLLGSKDYFFGDKLCTLDVVVYAFLAQTILVNIDCPVNAAARAYPSLVRFCEAFQQQYYSDSGK